MALSDVERAKVRLYLGYPSVGVAGAISMGLPTGHHGLFVVETSMNSVLPEAEPLVRRQLKELDCILDQVSHARGDLRISSVDEIVINPEQIGGLWDEYQRWAKMLSQTLAAPINPLSQINDSVNLIVLDNC